MLNKSVLNWTSVRQLHLKPNCTNSNKLDSCYLIRLIWGGASFPGARPRRPSWSRRRNCCRGAAGPTGRALPAPPCDPPVANVVKKYDWE